MEVSAGGVLSGVAAIIVALGGVMLAYVNSKMKQQEARQQAELDMQRKKFDIKIDEAQKHVELGRRSDNARLSAALGQIYGLLHKLAYTIEADRAFVVQPHPLDNKKLISVSLEVVPPIGGISTRKETFQCEKISEWGDFVKKLSNDDWLVYLDVSQIRDKRLYAQATLSGDKSLVFRRLIDDDGNWIGSLGIDYTRRAVDTSILSFVKGEIDKTAILIQAILPEYIPSRECVEKFEEIK